jgi:uncharacterized UPF0160 family protein
MFQRVEPSDSPSKAVIGTHSGSFQADEAMGVWMLQQIPAYRNSKIVRSRDLESTYYVASHTRKITMYIHITHSRITGNLLVLDKLDIVLDVGGTYDHSKLRYDHHQKEYDARFDPDRCTKLSASGLIYRHYGKQVLKAYYPNLTDELLEVAYKKLYDSLLEALDAIDTGVEMVPPGVRQVYKDTTGLASRVGRLNPRWNEEPQPEMDARFAQAVQMCGQDFVSAMTSIVESDIPAREIVENALLKRFEVDQSGEILCLNTGGLPWRSHLYELEKQHNVDPLVKFVLYTDQAEMWRVQAVTVEGMAFENRLSLPQEWRGVRDDDLEAVTQIPGSRFVHAAGFIGGNDTKEGALKMAQVALSTK